MSGIKHRLLNNRGALGDERAGIPSSRQTEREIAAIRQPDTAPVVSPPTITSAIKSGDAMKDVLGVLHDAGLIDDQSTAGTDRIVPLSDSVKGLDDLATPGIVVRTASGAFRVATMQTFAQGLTIENPDGVLKDPIFVLGNFISALNLIGGNGTPGLLATDGTDTFIAPRTLTAGAGIVVTNGAGAAGNPTIALAATISVTTLGVDGMIRAGANTGTPTLTRGSGAGTTANITSFAGGDYHGEFTLTPGGTGIAAGSQVTVAFQNALGNSSYDVLFMPRNNSAALIGPYLSVRNTGSFVMSFATAPVSGTGYSISFWVIGR